jgi:acylphosphatase
MSDWVRVATFEADDDAVEAMVKEISSAEGPPPAIPAKSILVLADRENGRARIVVRFDSEENLRTGSATLDGMEPPADASVRRISVEKYEVLLERQASENE